MFPARYESYYSLINEERSGLFMSTKIYNGFSLSGIKTLWELNDWVQQLRNQCLPLAIESVASEIARNAALKYDMASLSGPHRADEGDGEPLPRSNPFHDAYLNFLKSYQEIQKTGYRNPLVDFDFNISLLPVEDRVLGIFESEQTSWRDVLFSHQEVEDYAYWNQVDRPSGLSQQEWEERARLWKEALPGGAAPDERGFNFVIVTTRDILRSYEKLVEVACMPTFEARLQNAAKHLHVSRSVQEDQEQGDDVDVVSLVLRASRDKVGQLDLEKEIAPRLQEALEVSDITRTWSEILFEFDKGMQINIAD